MGAYSFITPYLKSVLGSRRGTNRDLRRPCRLPAATAAGQMPLHLKQLKALLDAAPG